MNRIASYLAAARQAEIARRALEPPRPIQDRPITRRHRLRHLLVALAAAAAAAGSLTPPAHAGPAEPTVPGGIQVPDGNKVFLVAHATGVQIYKCTTTGWAFVAPRADLYDQNGKLIATHFGGPTWQATDGSKVIGQRAADPVTVEANAIPWLLLSAASTSAGPDGARLLATTYIQRINTTGGLTPPAADCNAVTVGTQNEIPYTADYYFWKATGA